MFSMYSIPETSLDDSLEESIQSQTMTPYSLRSRSRNQSCSTSNSVGGSPILGGNADSSLEEALCR